MIPQQELFLKEIKQGSWSSDIYEHNVIKSREKHVLDLGKRSKKKIAEKETLVHMGGRGVK